MVKNILLFTLLSCTLLVSTQAAFKNMRDRLKNRVIHIESRMKPGRWLMQNDNSDEEGSKYLFIDPLAERDTYYTPKVQFLTTPCGSEYLCLESLSLRDHYLFAGRPPSRPDKFTVKLTKSTHPSSDNRMHWKIMCENDSLKKCQFTSIIPQYKDYFMVTDDWGKPSGNNGHYDATLGKKVEDSYFRIHAPNPTDKYVQIFQTINKGSSEQSAEYTTSVGVSTEKSSSHSWSVSVEVEIEKAFKAFSASLTTTIEHSWESSESKTFEQSKEVKLSVTIPPKTKLTLYQLKGTYDKKFTVGDDSYKIEEESLEDKSKQRERLAHPNKNRLLVPNKRNSLFNRRNRIIADRLFNRRFNVYAN